MHLLLYSGTCAHIRTYVSIHVHTPTHVHTRQHIYRYAVWFGREHTRRTERNTSRPHFQFVSVYLKNGERNPWSARSPLFQARRKICACQKKKDYCATIGVTFPPFHILFQNSRGRSDQRISLPEMHEFKNMNLINCLIDCIIFYRYKSDAPRVARIFTL